MFKDKIVIASGSKETLVLIKEQLETSMFSVVVESMSGNEVLRKVNALSPNAVITDYTLSDMTGLDLAQNIEPLHICPVIVLTNRMQGEYIEEFKKDALDIFCITKPVSDIVLNHIVSLAIRLARKIYTYESQINELKQKLENRKIIEKAKGILMRKFNLSEDEAYSQMRKKSMDLAKPIEQIAKTIVDMFKVFEE